MSTLRQLATDGDLDGLIATLRSQVAADRRVFTDPVVKAWCARRWRFLFLNEAVHDPVALDQASKRFLDRRPARQRIAEYFLLGADQAAWRDEQPDPTTPQIGGTTFLMCPGLANGLVPVLRAYKDQLPRVEQRFAMRVLRADSHPVRGCEANMADLLRALNEGKGLDAAGREIPEESARPPGDVLLMAYSKGAADVLTLLAQRPGIATRVRCVVTMCGAIGGSEVADKTAADLRRSKIQQGALSVTKDLKAMLPRWLRLGRYAGRRLPEFDIESAVLDLTTQVRSRFLDENSDQLDALDLPMFFLRGATRLNEVPWSQRGGFRLLSRTDSYNDMQVTSTRASLPLPMAVDLGMLRGHHWDLAYPSFIKGSWFGLNRTLHRFPRAATLAAIVALMEELGLID